MKRPGSAELRFIGWKVREAYKRFASPRLSDCGTYSAGEISRFLCPRAEAPDATSVEDSYENGALRHDPSVHARTLAARKTAPGLEPYDLGLIGW
jgi:hypothetical protein